MCLYACAGATEHGARRVDGIGPTATFPAVTIKAVTTLGGLSAARRDRPSEVRAACEPTYECTPRNCRERRPPPPPLPPR